MVISHFHIAEGTLSAKLDQGLDSNVDDYKRQWELIHGPARYYR